MSKTEDPSSDAGVKKKCQPLPRTCSARPSARRLVPHAEKKRTNFIKEKKRIMLAQHTKHFHTPGGGACIAKPQKTYVHSFSKYR